MVRGLPASTTIDPADLMRFPGARSSVLLSSLDPEGLDLLLRSATLARFTPYDTISPRHAPDDALHVLVHGSAIQLSWSFQDSDSYYARPVGAGEVLGLTDVLSVDPVLRETRALVPAMTVRIPGPAVRGLLTSSHLVAEGLTRVAVHVLRAAEADHVVLGTGDATARLTHRLLELVAGWGTAGDHGVDVDLPLTQAQLGAWAGVSRETTVKCLQWLRTKQLIRTSRRHITVVDLPALEQLTGRRGTDDVVRLRMERRPPGPIG